MSSYPLTKETCFTITYIRCTVGSTSSAQDSDHACQRMTLWDVKTG